MSRAGIFAAVALAALLCHLPLEARAGSRRPPDRAAPADCPGWTGSGMIRTGDACLFVGVSHPAAGEQAARTGALQNALRQAAEYAGVELFQSASETRNRKSDAGGSRVLVDGDFAAETLSKLFVSGSAARSWHVERLDAGETLGPWIAYVLLAVPQGEIDRAISESRRRRDRMRELYGVDGLSAVVYANQPDSPYLAALRDAVARYLSKSGVAVIDRAADDSSVHLLLEGLIHVDVERTLYDKQFISARIIVRAGRMLPSGAFVTTAVVSGTQRAYGRTVVAACEEAVDAFIQDMGHELLMAVQK